MRTINIFYLLCYLTSYSIFASPLPNPQTDVAFRDGADDSDVQPTADLLRRQGSQAIATLRGPLPAPRL